MSKVYQFDDSDLLKQVNHTYISVIDALRREKFLTVEDANTLMTEYSVIVEHKSWLPPFLSKWLGLDDDKIGLRLARVIAREEKTCE